MDMGLTILRMEERIGIRTQGCGPRVRKKEKGYSRGRAVPSILETIRIISSMVKEHRLVSTVRSTLGPGKMAKSTDLGSFTAEDE